MNMSAPWLTVVTVVKDDPRGLARTAASVSAQHDRDFQWVIVDGSTPALEPPATGDTDWQRVIYSWMPPRGIYPAMNDGLALASGQYILFLNAGDILAAPEALASLRQALVASGAPWVFCDVRFVDERGRTTVPPPFDFDDEQQHLFARGRFPPHQGTVVRTDLLRQVEGFDAEYQIAADYAAMLHLSRLHPGKHVPVILSEFTVGGVSTVQWSAALREFHRARRKILQPTGAASAAEYLATAVEWGKQALFNVAVRPLRRGSHTPSAKAENVTRE